MKLKRNREVIVILLALMFVVTACATTGQPMNQKQQVTIWNDMYSAQFDDTMYLMTSPTSTESQKALGRQKKAILMHVKPLLVIYSDLVDKGFTMPVLMNYYQAEFNSIDAILNTPLSPAFQKEIAKQKKAILDLIIPVLGIYLSMTPLAGTPTDVLMNDISVSMNKLGSIIGGAH